MGYREFAAWLCKEWPHPPDHVLARLRHVLDVFDSVSLDSVPADDDFVVVATNSVYVDHRGRQIATGLTWGDLRLIRDYLEHQWAEESARPMSPLLNIPLDTFNTDNPRPEIASCARVHDTDEEPS